MDSWLAAGSACLGFVLVSPRPGGPVPPVPGAVGRFAGQVGEEVGDLVAGQLDLPSGTWVSSVFGGGCDGQEGAGEHGEGDPPVPGGPAADLVVVQAGEAFAGLEVLLGGPPEPGDFHQRGQGDGLRGVAAVERQFPVARVAADQQPAASRRAAGDGDPGPVVVTVAFGPGQQALPGPLGQPGGEHVGAESPPGSGWYPVITRHGQDVATCTSSTQARSVLLSP
jgi:hypothetical protein